MCIKLRSNISSARQFPVTQATKQIKDKKTENILVCRYNFGLTGSCQFGEEIILKFQFQNF